MLLSLQNLRFHFVRWIPLLIGLLSLAYVATQWVYFALDRSLGGKIGLVQLFDLCDETNLPTVFSSLLLLGASALLGVMAARTLPRERSMGLLWLGLALIFAFLSFDEAAELHERWSFFLRRTLGQQQLLLDAWVIPYSILFAAVALAYIRFLVRLPRDTAWRFVVAGSLFVSAAVGFEIIESLYEASVGELDATYAALCGTEEVMEMAGVALFINAIMRHLCVHERIEGLSLVEAPPPREIVDRLVQSLDEGMSTRLEAPTTEEPQTLQSQQPAPRHSPERPNASGVA